MQTTARMGIEFWKCLWETFGLNLERRGDFEPEKLLPPAWRLCLSHALSGREEEAEEIAEFFIDFSCQQKWLQPPKYG